MKKTVLCNLLILFNILLTYSQKPSEFEINFKSNTTVVPISYRNGANPIIEVKINGNGPYKFMFDTGSPSVVKLDERVFKELHLSVKDSISAGDGSGINRKTFPITHLESINIGDYEISNVDAMVRNYNDRIGFDTIDGVIGLSFFKNVLVELNFENNQFIISKNKLEQTDDNVIKVATLNDMPTTQLKIGDKLLEAVFDTGNMGGLSIHSSNVSNDMIIGEPKVIGKAKTVSNEFEIKEAQLNHPISLGTIAFEKPIITMNDLLPKTNLGVKFLKQMNLTFDMTNGLVKVVKHLPKTNSVNQTISNEYAGQYGDRIVTENSDGFLYIQRPQGVLLKMISKNKDEYGLEAAPNAIIIFERDNENKIVAIKVNKGDGNWEKVLKI